MSAGELADLAEWADPQLPRQGHLHLAVRVTI